MSINPYASTPLCISQADPANGLFTKAYFFLGDIPNKVLSAAKNVKPKPKDIRMPTWNDTDSAILRGYYGENWLDLLTPKDPANVDIQGMTQLSAPRFFTGGFSDFGALDDLGDTEYVEVSFNSESERKKSDLNPILKGPPVYTNISVYPEDTIFDLRLKLCLATNIPFYRQHFFYYVNEEGPATPYRFSLDGTPILIDWRALANTDVENTNVIAGIMVDPRLEERKEGIRVEALDSFTLLSISPGVMVTSAFFIDLFSIIPPIGAYERPNDNLSDIIKDNYQFDILYYGGIIRYWPHLSLSACRTALSKPHEVYLSYPLLEPDQDVLLVRFTTEQELSEKALKWRETASKSGRSTTSVTNASVKISPRSTQTKVNIRNVFDWISTSIRAPASSARFDIDASLYINQSSMANKNGILSIFGKKQHLSSYRTRSVNILDSFLNKKQIKDSVTYALTRENPTDEDNIGSIVKYIYLTIFSDAKIEAKADWHEDDRIGFDTVISEITDIIKPILVEINKMGSAAFPIGGSLSTNYNRDLISLGAITMSAFWPNVLTNANFKFLKSQFRIYEKAGIVTIRGLQQSGAYVFTFRRGIVKYDSKLVDRVETGGIKVSDTNLSTQNQYSWLVDNNVATRWSTSFAGRLVKITHRVTDLKIEVANLDNLEEFNIIKRYIFSFLDSILKKLDTTQDDIIEDSPHRLRKLQEQDPNLFDLRKYDQNATVYSVLCQSGRQPAAYMDSERKLMNLDQKSKLTKYWNFTHSEDAYYECPDPDYPYLNFREGIHPLGYCLPCCKKTKVSIHSQASITNANCLKHHTIQQTNKIDIKSRHVFAYGKPLVVNRISDLPSIIVNSLLLNSIQAPYKFKLLGVDQYTPSIPNAGFAFALATALMSAERTIDDIFTELAQAVLEMPDTYYILGNGGGMAFKSAQHLSDVILGSFVRKDLDLSPFGPGGFACNTWIDILQELVRYLYGVEVVLMADPGGLGLISLETTSEASTAIINSSYTNTRIVILVSNPTGIYPIAALNPKFYIRVKNKDKWMASRRIFSEKSMNKGIEDSVLENIRNVLLYQNSLNVDTMIDLSVIKSYTNSQSKRFTIKSLLVNLHNLCYGVILQGCTPDVKNSIAYIPVRLSPYLTDGTSIILGPRPDDSYPYITLLAAIEDINVFITSTGGLYSLIKHNSLISDEKNQIIGFNFEKSTTLHFYHNAIKPTKEMMTNNIIKFPYNVCDIDRAIIDSLKTKKVYTPSTLATSASVRNRLYSRFLTEFSHIMRADRNETIRNKLYNLFKTTRYDVVSSVSNLRYRLIEILNKYPSDLVSIRNIISTSYTNSYNPSKNILEMVTDTSFVFDRIHMEMLKNTKTHADTVNLLQTILGPRIEVSDTEVKSTKNIYVSCSETSSILDVNDSCINNRLVVPSDRIKDFYDILAYDISNPSKIDIILSISTGVFEPLDFIRRPEENLTLYTG